jgi:hypothetical protein
MTLGEELVAARDRIRELQNSQAELVATLRIASRVLWNEDAEYVLKATATRIDETLARVRF